ncbi:MAG: DNA mismatch repair endonuclease MutL [Paludibacteraceae bacterium]|nr:DNA mismatch repair endonuclease MutL [Paludibacteraceae bacterium]
MDVIRLLPDSVANQIAAGEVIQRPASCLKELVENSLDAGAHHVRVLVRDAGKSLIQVIDDGSGMSVSDARMAFERHATSKIREAQDLFHLRTMGFRGEALPSICAVAQVKMTTRRSADEVGTMLDIAGSQVERQEPCQCPVGTSIQVQNLFFNVPARRRFLKSDQTELRNLITTFQHIVLVYPDIAFTFVADDEIVYDLPVGTLKQRIEGVFGKSKNKLFTSQLLEIEQQTELVTIRGFVGKPEAASKQAQQFFFVNGRYMRHPYFHKAVLQAYSGMLQAEQLPPYFIYFEIAPEQIDVNVHPTKTEIKFADEQSIFPILSATVRAALGKFNVVPSIDFLGGNIEIPVADDAMRANAKAPQLHVSTGYNPFAQQHERVTPHWQDLYEPLKQPQQLASQLSVEPQQTELPHDLTELPLHPQAVAGGYITCATENGLMIIHARRAHITILYHQLIAQLRDQRGASQQLLFPEQLTVSTEEQTALDALLPDLQHIGFELEKVAAGQYDITAMPSVLGNKNAETALRAIIARSVDGQMDVREDMQQRIALTLAQSAAISMGKPLSEVEMEDMLRRLFALPSHRITPDGKTVIVLLSTEDIARRF